MSALSYRHPRILRLRRLVARREQREEERILVVESPTLLDEALRAGATVESVYVEAGSAESGAHRGLLRRAGAAGAEVCELEHGVIGRVASTVTPQPVLALIAAVDVALESLREASLVLVCAGVSDPGNAGTLLRSAGAAGADGVVFCDGSVDVYNPKTVRASAGSLFHVPVVIGSEAVSVLERLGDWGLRRLAAVAADGADYTTTDLASPIALVVGNEAHGLAAETVAATDERITIPMASGAESVNAGVAGSVLLFEAARQRRAAP